MSAVPDCSFSTSNLTSMCEQVKTRLAPFCFSLPRNSALTKSKPWLFLLQTWQEQAGEHRTPWRAKSTPSIFLKRGFFPQQPLPALTLRALTGMKWAWRPQPSSSLPVLAKCLFQPLLNVSLVPLLNSKDRANAGLIECLGWLICNEIHAHALLQQDSLYYSRTTTDHTQTTQHQCLTPWK